MKKQPFESTVIILGVRKQWKTWKSVFLGVEKRDDLGVKNGGSRGVKTAYTSDQKGHKGLEKHEKRSFS